MMMTTVIVAVKIGYKYSDYDGASCENYDEEALWTMLDVGNYDN